jgi:hypothetical protein
LSENIIGGVGEENIVALGAACMHHLVRKIIIIHMKSQRQNSYVMLMLSANANWRLKEGAAKWEIKVIVFEICPVERAANSGGIIEVSGRPDHILSCCIWLGQLTIVTVIWRVIAKIPRIVNVEARRRRWQASSIMGIDAWWHGKALAVWKLIVETRYVAGKGMVRRAK